jgi:hypothetical protein
MMMMMMMMMTMTTTTTMMMTTGVGRELYCLVWIGVSFVDAYGLLV